MADADHEQRLRATLDAYPQGYSTDRQCNWMVRARADDLRQLLGDIHAYRETCRVAAIIPEDATLSGRTGSEAYTAEGNASRDHNLPSPRLHQEGGEPHG